MPFELKPLPYEEHALEPAIGRETVSIHYHKHHGGYVSKLNDALSGESKDQSLESVIENARGKHDRSVYNLAAQVWNHDFYWRSMTPDHVRLDGELARQLDSTFGSRSEFEETFRTAALNEFGSGWTWLCWDVKAGKLDILSTTDAVIPHPDTHRPVLTLDVWEHAYYLDYQNDRAAYIEAFLEHLIDWETAGRRLDDALTVTREAEDRKRAARHLTSSS